MSVDDSGLMTLPKQYRGAVIVAPKETNAYLKVISFRPHGDDDLPIPGVTVEIHWRIGQTADRCKYLFTLFKLRNQKKQRVYQLEVVPRDKRSHNGVPRIYGPHEHFGEGDQTVYAVTNGLTCKDYKDWLSLFCQRINLKLDAELPKPFGDQNEMQLDD